MGEVRVRADGRDAPGSSGCMPREQADDIDFRRLLMGANSTQGWATLLFLAAFTFLSWSLFAEGSVVFLLLFVVLLGASVALFLKCKTWEHAKP
jgi:hypothetical protein